MYPNDTIMITDSIPGTSNRAASEQVISESNQGRTGYSPLTNNCAQNAARVLTGAGGDQVLAGISDPAILYQKVAGKYGVGVMIYSPSYGGGRPVRHFP